MAGSVKRAKQNNNIDSKPSLEFLLVTGLSNDEEFRRIVRSHAIRDANRRKRANQTTNFRKAPEADRPPLQNSLTTKFRLSNKSKIKSSLPENDVQEDDLAARIKSFQTVVQQDNIVSTMTSGLRRFDPFDTLPVKIGARQASLLQYRESKIVVPTQILTGAPIRK